MNLTPDWLQRLKALAPGYQEVSYRGRRYGLTRQDFNQGRSLKVYAEELGGSDFISFNLYYLREQAQLKPCEMPDEKVLDFLRGMVR